MRNKKKYLESIEYIALNDEPGELLVEAMQGYASVHVVSVIFDVSSERVAKDVVEYRIKYEKGFTRHPEACTFCNGVGGHYSFCRTGL